MTDAELIALAAMVNAETTEVMAANMDRQSRGDAMAYDGLHCEAWAVLEIELRRRGCLPEEKRPGDVGEIER